MNKRILRFGFYFLLIVLGYLIHKSGIINSLYQTYSQYREFKTQIESAKEIEPKSIKIFLSNKNLDKLYEQRRLALEIGQDYKEDLRFTGYVKGKLVYNDDTLKIKLRQKGLFPDHFEDSLRCSYKIKISDNKTFLGMERFAIQHPKTRGHLNEWYFHQLLNYVGLISLRYEFVEIEINERNSGIYAVEENMHKNLIVNNNRKEGPIFRFEIIGDGAVFFHKIRPYNSKRLRNDIDLSAQFNNAKMMLYDFRAGLLKSSEVFDIEKMAKFYAIIDLTGHHHASHVFNLKFYFNPESSKIEPIGYDNSSIVSLKHEGILGRFKNVEVPIKNKGEILWKNGPFYEVLFNDTIFFKHYIHYLQEFSKSEWLSTFFSKTQDTADIFLKILWRSYPEYEFDGKNVLVSNQKIIKEALNECEEPEIENNIVYQNNGENIFYIKNNDEFPVVITSYSADNKNYLVTDAILQPFYRGEFPYYTKISFENKEQSLISISIKYKILGTDQIHTSTYDCKVKTSFD